MIDNFQLSPDEDLSPAKIRWDEDKDDYVCSIPEGITRGDLNRLVMKINKITEWRDDR